MNLAEILKKTKAKSERITTTRHPPSIATEDRPYSITDTPNNPLEKNLETSPAYFIEITNEKKLPFIEEIQNKFIKNKQQTDNKPITNWQQTDNKLATNQKQKIRKEGVEYKNWQQTDNTTDNTTDNKPTTNWQQTNNKLATKTVFSELVGLQRDIIIFICRECKSIRSRTTEALTLEYIAITLKRSTGAIKTTIQRLEKKGCLLRVAFKNGRGGWSKYELPNDMYHDVLRNETDNKLATNWQQTDNKLASQPTTELATSESSSSSINIKKTTTQLEEEWNFDITPYAKFGFTTSQLKQLISLRIISAADVEQSLIEFNYDFINNSLPVIKTGNINFLMGLLRSGHSYVSEGFKNEQEAMISAMAKRAEDKRRKLLEDKFVVWEEELNEEERKAIENKIPMKLKVLHHAHGISNLEVKEWLFNYYLQTHTYY
jgi:hypothetical protein